MSATLALSNCLFIQSREREYKIELRLSRGAVCVISGEPKNLWERLQMWACALRLRQTDRWWAKIEKEYFECFELWKRGDEMLEEFLTDSPNDYHDISVQQAIANRLDTQRKLIFVGELMLQVDLGHAGEPAPALPPTQPVRHRAGGSNPFLNTQRVKALVQMLRDDLDDQPAGYFRSLSDGEGTNEQGVFKLDQGRLQ